MMEQQMKEGVFFLNVTATTEIYTLSLHDALPIFRGDPQIVGKTQRLNGVMHTIVGVAPERSEEHTSELHHSQTSYAVFCLKKKKPQPKRIPGPGEKTRGRDALQRDHRL